MSPIYWLLSDQLSWRKIYLSDETLCVGCSILAYVYFKLFLPTKNSEDCLHDLKEHGISLQIELTMQVE